MKWQREHKPEGGDPESFVASLASFLRDSMMTLPEKDRLNPRDYGRLGFNSYFCAGCTYFSPQKEEEALICLKCLDKQDWFYRNETSIEVTKDEKGKRVARLA